MATTTQYDNAEGDNETYVGELSEKGHSKDELSSFDVYGEAGESVDSEYILLIAVTVGC